MNANRLYQIFVNRFMNLHTVCYLHSPVLGTVNLRLKEWDLSHTKFSFIGNEKNQLCFMALFMCLNLYIYLLAGLCSQFC